MHSSVTRRVYFALDHNPAAAVNGAAPRVALKFLRHYEHFSAEVVVRDHAIAAQTSFLSIIASFDADVDNKFNAELVTPYAENVTARTVFNRITGFQSAFLENDSAASLKAACASVVKVLTWN